MTYALPAGATPNFIFPFAPSSVYTIVNLDNLQYLLYRPLYWFGDSGLPYLNEKLSLAYEPRYKGQVVSFRLKSGLRWTDGTPVTAQNVVFWMNMMKAEAATNFGGYVPTRLPQNVKDIRAIGTSEVRMTIIGPYSPLWFTDNELSQITPMPKVWDRSGPNTKSDCTDNWHDCTAVFNYLFSQAGLKQAGHWATSPLWRVVDGPWKLASYDSQGVLTFSYNRLYGLYVPPHHISTFRELPFTTEQAEYNQLQAGGSATIDVGYLPTVDAPVPPPGASIGQNPVPNYSLQPVYTWGLSYIPFNFNTTGDKQVAIFDQVYFRHAFQLLVNQAQIIQGALHGYGKISTGPVGDAPETPYLSPQARQGDPNPFNPAEAEKLLTDHGWRVNPAGGVTMCVNPGAGAKQCGPGVKLHAKLSFSMLYATGSAWIQAAVLQLKSNALQVGIQIKLTGMPFDQLIGVVANGCGPNPSTPGPCPWQLADWGQGWSYVPDYLPTGDELFQSGSIGNLGEYGDKHDDNLIAATLDKQSQSAFLRAMYTWQNWLTGQFPVAMQPTAPASLLESIDSLHIGQQSPTLALTPEDWYYVR